MTELVQILIENEKTIVEYILKNYDLAKIFGLTPFKPAKAICGVEFIFDPNTLNRLDRHPGSNFKGTDTTLDLSLSDKPHKNISELINDSDKTISLTDYMKLKDDDAFLSRSSTADTSSADLQREEYSVWWHTETIEKRSNSLNSNIYASLKDKWEKDEKFCSFKELDFKSCLAKEILKKIGEVIVKIAERGVEFLRFPGELIEISMQQETKIRMIPHNISKIAKINSSIDLERYRGVIEEWLKPYAKEIRFIKSLHYELTPSDFNRASEIAISGLYKGNQVQSWITPKKNSQLYIDYYYELKTLKDLSHKNILKVYGLHDTKNFCSLIVEECKSLKSTLEENISVQKVVKIGLEIAEGVKYIHDQNFICGCLTPENIFINCQSKIVLGRLRIAKAEFAAFFCAPEVLANREVEAAADIWSFGMILYWMLAKRIPFDYLRDSEDFSFKFLSDSIEFNRRKPMLDRRIEEKYPKLVSLIRDTWSILPENRPVIEDIIEDLKEILDEINNN
ncbi:unnamed protein product [Blepharisma stoltei]|uniref:Protein kinase domain-containing protein n=1 Tax=Blepharisma stoltei TaxID=1481888 RepID=A0AAU9IQP0_9CILI|nr:unnamed protein product [Blepharisma stoltei]